MKKLLLLITTISCICFSGNFIDLKLKDKPRNIKSYDWCKKVVKKFVQKKEEKILQLLNIKNKKEWANEKSKFKQEYKEAIGSKYYIKKQRAHSDKIKKNILNILHKPYIQKTFGITKIKIENNIIIAERKNNLPIKFLTDHPEDFNLKIGTDGYNVFISPEIDIREEVLEGVICHELGHILSNDYIESISLIREYNNQTTKISSEKINKMINELEKAHEAQADIIGAFNNIIWIKQLKKYLKIYALSSDERHPKPEQRINYLRDICNSIQQDNVHIKKSYKTKITKKTKNITNISNISNRILQYEQFFKNNPQRLTYKNQ